MDPATIVGLILAFGAMFTMMSLEHVPVEAVFLPAPMIFVFGATIASTIASGPLSDSIASVKAVPRAFLGKRPNHQVHIDRLVELARVARSDGMLALEAQAREEKDEFLAGGLQSMADGVDGEALRDQLENWVESKTTGDKIPIKFFFNMGSYAPTIGVIGTVLTMLHALANLSSPDKLGPMIAAAFVATLWGLVTSNLMWLPISAKLQRLSEMEVQGMMITTEGLLSIQEGAQPLMLAERLESMLPAGSAKKKDADEPVAAAGGSA